MRRSIFHGRSKRLVWLASIVAALGGCLYPPTEVVVTVSTDVPPEQLRDGVLRAVVRQGDVTLPIMSLQDASIVGCVTPAMSDGSTDVIGTARDGGIDATLGADASMVDGSAGRCIATQAISSGPALTTIGSFGVVPRQGGARDESFEVLVSLDTPHMQLRRLLDHQRLVPRTLQHVSIMLRQSCDRVLPAGGGVCGAQPCTLEEACRVHGSSCAVMNGVGACVSNGQCDPGENACIDPTCPAIAGDGCCSPGESPCTPEPACAPRPGDQCCTRDANETSCNESACMPVGGDGCCSAGEAICRGEAACAARPMDGCCSPGENNCNASSDCAVAAGDGCCSAGEAICRGETACAVRPMDGCCSPGENNCNTASDCPVAIGDGCCSGGENSCNESACAVRCGDGCCMAGAEFGCNCQSDCPTSLTWSASDPGIGHNVGTACGAAWCATGTATPAGHLWFGPYTRGVPSGRPCTAHFSLATDALSAADATVLATVDVNDADTGGVIASANVARNQLQPLGTVVDFPLNFTTPNCDRLEFRVYWPSVGHILQVHSVHVTCG